MEGPSVSATTERELPADQLGRWRFAVRGELRALPRLLRGDEPVLTMALGSIGLWKGRLFVATPSRLLLVGKAPLRPVQCTEIPYPRIRVLGAASEGGLLRVSVAARSEQQTWYLKPAGSGECLLRLITEGGGTYAPTEPAQAGLTESSIAKASSTGPPILQESVDVRGEVLEEPAALEELALIWEDPLELRLREAYPRERWLLHQRGRTVAAVEQTRTGWSLASAAQHCNAAVRGRRRRLGWHLEVTPAGERAPLAQYRPSTFGAGGTITLASGGSYKFRGPAWLDSDWTLADPGGDELARISLRMSPPSGSAVARDKTGLKPAAAREPNVALLVTTACAAMAIHHQQPTGGSVV